MHREPAIRSQPAGSRALLSWLLLIDNHRRVAESEMDLRRLNNQLTLAGVLLVLAFGTPAVADVGDGGPNDEVSWRTRCTFDHRSGGPRIWVQIMNRYRNRTVDVRWHVVHGPGRSHSYNTTLLPRHTAPEQRTRMPCNPHFPMIVNIESVNVRMP